MDYDEGSQLTKAQAEKIDVMVQDLFHKEKIEIDKKFEEKLSEAETRIKEHFTALIQPLSDLFLKEKIENDKKFEEKLSEAETRLEEKLSEAETRIKEHFTALSQPLSA